MDNVQAVITDERGVKYSIHKRRSWNMQNTDLTEEQDRANHMILSKLFRPGVPGNSEKEFAKLCGYDMHSDSWKASLTWLRDKSYIKWDSQEYDGFETCAMVELPDDKRKVYLLGSGQHFAARSYEELMRIAG